MSVSSDRPLPEDSYVVLGLATCFIKADGKLQSVQVVEPIPSAALEALIQGLPTSYSQARAMTLAESSEESTALAHFPGDAQFADDFSERLQAAARTYRSRQEATRHIPLGTTYSDFNFSTERKRILNSERMVTAADNVKQHAYTHEVL